MAETKLRRGNAVSLGASLGMWFYAKGGFHKAGGSHLSCQLRNRDLLSTAFTFQPSPILSSSRTEAPCAPQPCSFGLARDPPQGHLTQLQMGKALCLPVSKQALEKPVSSYSKSDLNRAYMNSARRDGRKAHS